MISKEYMVNREERLKLPMLIVQLEGVLGYYNEIK